MVDGYELSEDAARRTAAAVRKVEAMGPPAANAAAAGRNVPYKPAFYRLATNDGDGKYTCRRQAWDDTEKKFIDVGEPHQAEYNIDVTAYDFRQRADGVTGAADVGQIVSGWKIHVGGATPTDGTWITLVDVATKNGCFPVDLAQVGGTDGNATTAASWTYDVKDPMAPDDADPLVAAVNPTASPHKWRRPTGVMTKATFGHAHFDKTGALVIGWINEVAVQEACP